MQLCNWKTDILKNAADKMERWLDSYIGTLQGCTVSMSRGQSEWPGVEWGKMRLSLLVPSGACA